MKRYEAQWDTIARKPETKQVDETFFSVALGYDHTDRERIQALKVGETATLGGDHTVARMA